MLAHDVTTGDTFPISPIIPYGPNTIDVKNQNFISPFEHQNVPNYYYRHWLGTDKLGRDVAAQMIHGTQTSLIIGFLSVVLAFIPGVFIGLIAGYKGDKGFKVHWIVGVLSGLATVLVIFYLVYLPWHFWSKVWLFFVTLIVSLALFSRMNTALLRYSGVGFYFPFDGVLMRIIEIRKSLPALFILLGLLTYFSDSGIMSLTVIIALLSWTEFARFTRAEVINIKSESYITSARTLGFDTIRIVVRHILPNILPTLAVVACFGFSGAILLESSLSFLGIGIPIESASLGMILAGGRHLQAWWMVVFPGLMIFMIIFSLNQVASYFQEQ